VRQEEELGARDTALAAAAREAQVLSQNIETCKSEVSEGVLSGHVLISATADVWKCS
jgi:hypothetical protein